VSQKVENKKQDFLTRHTKDRYVSKSCFKGRREMDMKYGYARISHHSQKIQRQTEALEVFGVDKLFQDVQSGKDDERPAFQKLLEVANPGDTIVIHSLDRLMRSMFHLWKVIEELRKKEINLVSLNEPWLDISGNNAQSNLMLNIMGSFAQFERENLKIRQREGIEIALNNPDSNYGRPKKDVATVRHAMKLYQDKTHTVKEIERITGISKATLYRRLKENEEA